MPKLAEVLSLLGDAGKEAALFGVASDWLEDASRPDVATGLRRLVAEMHYPATDSTGGWVYVEPTLHSHDAGRLAWFSALAGGEPCRVGNWRPWHDNARRWPTFEEAVLAMARAIAEVEVRRAA